MEEREGQEMTEEMKGYIYGLLKLWPNSFESLVYFYGASWALYGDSEQTFITRVRFAMGDNKARRI